MRAVWDGKPRRNPRKGEWYLSGAIIEAYLAPSDLNSPFHIAVLARTATKTRAVAPYKGEQNG